jgi:uncharacterized membrane protein
MLKKLQIIIAVVCAVYLAVRLWRLADSCLWFDEIFSVHAAEMAWSDLFNFVARDLIHPPLFYVILKLWIGVTGEGVFALRMLPVLFSLLAVVPFINLAKELKFERPVIAIALGLMAVNGALIKYTQTLRMYSLLMFLAIASMWLFARFFNRGKSFVPLLIVNFFLIYTHYFGWLVVGTEIVALLIFQRIKWRRAAVMTGILVASYVPWLWAVWHAAGEGSDVAQNIAWQPRPGVKELLTFLLDLVEPIYYQASSAEPASIYLISIPLLLIALISLVLFFVDWNKQDQKQGLWLLTMLVGVPLVLTFIASWVLPQSLWGTRHLIVVFPVAMLLIANAVWKLDSSAARTVVITALVFFSGVAIFQAFRRESPRYVWCAWNDVASEIAQVESSNDEPVTVYAFENLVAYHLWFAFRQTDRFKVAVVKGLDVRTADETYFLPRGFDAVKTVRLDEVSEEDIWLAYRISSRDDVSPKLSFESKGYCTTEDGDARVYDTTRVYRVKMTNRSKDCP